MPSSLASIRCVACYALPGTDARMLLPGGGHGGCPVGAQRPRPPRYFRTAHLPGLAPNQTTKLGFELPLELAEQGRHDLVGVRVAVGR
eukprot:3164637-Rhodomonas_salina.2